MPGSVQQRRRAFLSLALIPLAPRARASTLPTVGILDVLDAKSSDFIRYLVPGMQRLGYVEGKNIRYAFRHLDWDFSKAERFADELVKLAPDALVTETSLAIRALRKNTSRIPIVAACSDPVGSGFTQSLSKPSGNVIGFTLNSREIATKQVELLKAMVPGLSHIVILGKDRGQNEIARETIRIATGQIGEIASAQGLTTSSMFFRNRDDAVDGLQALKRQDVRAAIDIDVSPSILSDEDYADLAIAAGVAVAGGASGNEKLLFSYYQDGAEALQWFRSRWPHLIDRVLHGTPPSDLPFEAPNRYLMTINLRTARALKLVIPAHVMARAEKTIR